ncbi:LysR substrate-binding domain-containing protein, partial [Desulfobacula sp.]
MILQEEFVTDEMQLIIPSDHRWAQKNAVNCRELFSEPFIKREKGSGTWQTILKSMEQAGFDPRKLKAPV